MVEQNLEEISEAEAALYDRQIRLWGLDAQKRLRSAKILVAGVNGLGAEICKNIVLAGVKSLTLLDSASVTVEDSCAQFFVTNEDVGNNRAVCSLPKIQQLNPMVEIIADTDKVEEKPDEFFLKFDVICLTTCLSSVAIRIDHLCHKNNIKFFHGEVNGYFGHMFADLGNHEFVEEVLQQSVKIESENGSPVAKKSKSDNDSKMIKRNISFVPMENALTVDWRISANKIKSKRLTSSYFIMKVISEFVNTVGRRPNLASKEEDIESLSTILNDFVEATGLEKIDETFIRFCFAELSPVCAIVGGVLAQEIVKAVSLRDRPHNNFFFYNGLSGDGTVENIPG